jgi:thiamine-monophosphate kinase
MQEMGEFELLSRLRRRLPSSSERVILGSGDDAAVSVPSGATATSVDASVDGVHFRREQMTLAAIGRRALAVALSDLAAMGAEPGEAYAILGLPPDLGEEEALEILEGMAGLASELAVTLAGGDLTRSPVLALGVTVVGHAGSPADLITRAGATPGDVLLLSGEIGAAAAGLLLAERPELTDAVPGETSERLRRRLFDPSPRLAVGATLASAGATAMIDISDGLGADAGHLAEASAAGLRIDAGLLPLSEGVDAVARAAGLSSGVQLAVSGGEDYELLASVPEERAGAAMESVRAAGCAISRIGVVVAGEGAEISSEDGRRLSPGGYDQLA